MSCIDSCSIFLINSMAPNSTQLLEAEQEQMLIKTSIGPMLLALGIAYLLAWYMHHETSKRLVIIWLTTFNLVTFYRVWIVIFALKTRKNNGTKSHHTLFTSGVISAATCWGISSFVLFPQSPALQTIFITSITGICAGAIGALCASWPSVSSFLCITLIPLTLRLFMVRDDDHLVLGGLTSLFLLVCLLGARKIHINIKQNILLRLKSDEAEKQIEHQSRYDELTDLPNRKQLLEILDQDMARSTRHLQTGALLLIDLDHFKTVNDSLGHSAGDSIIREVAARITETIRKEDVTARLGGDEFAIVTPQLNQSRRIAAQKAHVVSGKITDALSTPFYVQDQEISLTQSIGISLYPENDKNVEDILKQADTALNQAKTSGRNTVRFFQPDMQEAADARLQLHSDIKKAIENEEFSVYFQPQVYADGTIIGAEGLLRWTHPERGMVSPATFIPVAEESALIVDIGTCVLRKVCATIRHWEQDNLLPDDFCIAMNISAREFAEPRFVSKVIDTIAEFGISPRHLGIELTEGSLISSITDTIKKIEALKNHGIKFSVDDFGTGYSSLSYLKSLPLHTLKIDRSFVQDIQNHGDEFPLVETIITLAHNLGLEIVAEGVETTVELQFLAAKGCKIYQGYYFHKPMPETDFTELLRNKRNKTSS